MLNNCLVSESKSEEQDRSSSDITPWSKYEEEKPDSVQEDKEPESVDVEEDKPNSIQEGKVSNLNNYLSARDWHCL